MAKPIKETPILTSKDSERFAQLIEENKNSRASKKEYERVMANYQKLKVKLKV